MEFESIMLSGIKPNSESRMYAFSYMWKRERKREKNGGWVSHKNRKETSRVEKRD